MLKIERILVLSHMFPHAQQPNSGCFVAEQVKALRDFEGLDARVLSCRPVWCSRRPAVMLEALKTWKKQKEQAQWFSHEGVPTLFIPYLAGGPFEVQGYLHAGALMSAIRQVRKDFDFQLLHAHTAFPDGYGGFCTSSRYGVPLVITEHTGPFSHLTDRRRVRSMTVKALQSASRVICVSSALADEVKRWVPQEYHRRFSVIPNGVDTDLFCPRERDIPSAEPAACNILSVISFDQNKNPFCLLEAFRIVMSRGVPARLTMAGEGPLREKACRWISDNALEDAVSLPGMLPRSEIARIMRDECDVFVLPSNLETFGVVVIEALASGKPVVSTRCGGPHDVITESFLGDLCDVNNPEKMADALEKVLTHREQHPAERIRAYAAEHFGYGTIARKINDIYQEMPLVEGCSALR